MKRKLYKDILATSILAGIIAFIYGVYWVGRYSTPEAAHFIFMSIMILLLVIFLGAIWVAIRQIIN